MSKEENIENEEWIIVTKKTKKKYIQKQYKNDKIMIKGGKKSYSPKTDSESVREHFKQHKSTVHNQTILVNMLQKRKYPKVKVTCLGLGHFQSELKPQLQFLFLQLCIVESLIEYKIQYSLNVYDPIFSQQELMQIKQMGSISKSFTELEEQYTHILYMPHCDRILYEGICSLRRSNKKCQIIVIGNSINDYIQMAKLISGPIPEQFQHFKPTDQKMHDYKEAFNDTFFYWL